MAEQQALIDWPLTPHTGWGNYGIQLAQALLEQGRYVPRLLACNDRSPHCDLHWLEALQYLEDQSSPLMQQLAAAEGAGRLPVVTHAPLGFSPSATMCQRLALRPLVMWGVTFSSAVASPTKIWRSLGTLI